MTTLSLGRGSIFVLALCLMVIIAFSFVLGMVSAMATRGHEAGTVVAAECAPAPNAHAMIAEGGQGGGGRGEAREAAAREGGDARGVEGVEGGEGGEEGEGNILDRAGVQSRHLAQQKAREAAEGPVNHAFEMLEEHVSELLGEYLPLPKDPRLNPMLFLNKEIDEAKEDQDAKLQDLISGQIGEDKKGGEGGEAVGGKAGGEKAASEKAGGEKAGDEKAGGEGGAKAAGGKVEAAKGEPAKADAKAAPAKPALPVAQLPAAAVPAGRTLYAIELGRFRSTANAQSFAEDVKNRGYDVNIEAQKDSFGQNWFFVRLGQYPDSMDAARHLEAFEQHEGINGVLVVLTPPVQSASAAAAK